MTTVIERSGATITEFRRPRSSDGPAILAMFDRCGRETRYRRWHGHTYRFPPAYLAGVLSGSDHDLAIVVVSGDGQIVGLGSAPVVVPGAREIALLIEDGWQRHGLGRELLGYLVRQARTLGTRRLRVELLADDVWLVRLLRWYGSTTTRLSDGLVTATTQIVDDRTIGASEDRADPAGLSD